jgi:hypothetical protein
MSIVKLFPGQQDDEKICLIIRQYWVLFAMKLLVWFVFVALMFVVHWAIGRFLPELLMPPYVQIVNLVETVYIMFLFLGLLIMWVLYYLNVHIVTNERVVDITQKSIVSHTISELHLNRIQDVTAEVHGFTQTFLDYGNVYLQTAGETERFMFENVANPTKVSKLILDLYEQLPPEEKAKGQG